MVTNRAITPCMERIAPVVAEYERALEAARQGGADRNALEADICLASRSIYGRFKTWVQFYSVIDSDAEKVLDELFQQSLDVLNPNGNFYDIVSDRYERFKSKCELVREGHMTSHFAR
ncbi:MAG: hypothetical protein ACRC8S_14150 [Fimbriiglobus sp.]